MFSILLNLGMWFQLLGKKKNIVDMIRLFFNCFCVKNFIFLTNGILIQLCRNWFNIFNNVDIVIFRFEKMENGCRKDLDVLKNVFKYNDFVFKFYYENKIFFLVQ